VTAYVILNPYAGRWQALKQREALEAALKAVQVDYRLEVTRAPGHATEIAARAVQDGFSPIVAAGGDGTISEVVNGMVQAAPDGDLPPLGIIPLGSANDLSDNLGLPKDISGACQGIAGGRVDRIDLCRLDWQAAGQRGTRYFDNNAAIGLEPYITLIQQRMRRLRGTLRYLVATISGVIQNPSWKMQIEWEQSAYEGPVTLVTVGNNPRTGGVFYVTPHADPRDGLLTFVYGYIQGRLNILQVLPKTMQPAAGNYVEHPAIHEQNTRWLRIRSLNPTPLHADGEIQTRQADSVEFAIQPGILPVLGNGRSQ
jgi:YegS/Rv2252/BmrU family lipid kinase